MRRSTRISLRRDVDRCVARDAPGHRAAAPARTSRSNVLVCGELGRAPVHRAQNSSRGPSADSPFIRVDCARGGAVFRNGLFGRATAAATGMAAEPSRALRAAAPSIERMAARSSCKTFPIYPRAPSRVCLASFATAGHDGGDGGVIDVDLRVITSGDPASRRRGWRRRSGIGSSAWPCCAWICRRFAIAAKTFHSWPLTWSRSLRAVERALQGVSRRRAKHARGPCRGARQWHGAAQPARESGVPGDGAQHRSRWMCCLMSSLTAHAALVPCGFLAP